jgi:hypothetical protein
LFGRRPYVISRVGLTEGWRMHIGRCGGVSSPRAPTVAGMALQCPRRWHSGGDGRIGPEVTKETRSAGLMSRRRPGRARGRWPYPFRGFPRPLSRGATWGAVQEWVVQCLGVDTGLSAQLPHSAGDGRTTRVGGTAPGYDSQAVSEGRSWRGFAFDPSARGAPEHLML